MCMDCILSSLKNKCNFCHSFLKINILNVPFYSDNPALVFKTLADITKRDTSPNSDEEGELQETVTNMQLILLE